jgi:uncharacterized protein YndB with AHSA1/START domain
MRRRGSILLVVGKIGLALVAIGLALPREHEVARSARVNAPVPRVFNVIRDVEQYPLWRSDVENVVVLPDDGNGFRFQEISGEDVVTYRIENEQAPSLIEVRIIDSSLPFGGSWTYVLQPFDAGTSVTITEKGEIYNPIFRLLSRTLFSPSDTMERFLRDLTRAEISRR